MKTRLLPLLLLLSLNPARADVCSRNPAETDYVQTRRVGSGVMIRFCAAEGACVDQGFYSVENLDHNRLRLYRSTADVLMERGLLKAGLASGMAGAVVAVGLLGVGATAAAAGDAAALAAKLNHPLPQVATITSLGGALPLVFGLPAIFGGPIAAGILLVVHDDFDSRTDQEKVIDDAETHGPGDYLAEASALSRNFLLVGTRESGHCQLVDSMPEYQRHLTQALQSMAFSRP